MKKETIIAIALGICLGLVVAVIVTLKTRNTETKKVTPISNTLHVTPTIVAKNLQASSFELTEPQQEAIVTKNSVLIKGRAPKGSLIVIQSPIQTLTFTNDTENFEKTFSLALGENVILATAYPKTQGGSGIERELKVYYLDEE